MTPRTESQVLADLAANKRGNDFGIVNGEPKWFNVQKLASIVTYLDLKNDQVILNAVGTTSVKLGPIVVASPLEEVRLCRNFVAHKSPPTWLDIQSYTQGQPSDLSSHMRNLRSGVETFSEWCEALAAIAETAAQ